MNRPGVAARQRERDSREHALAHLFVGVAGLALLSAVGLLWRPRPDESAPFGRIALLGLRPLLAFTFMLESIGGAGYEGGAGYTRFPPDGHRIEALTKLHGLVGLFSLLAFVLTPVAVAATSLSAIAAWIRRRRPVA